MTGSRPPTVLRIATRESRLALWQAEHVAALLRAHYPDCKVELLGMTTRGDRILDKPLSEIGGKGLFTKELEVALHDGRADLAVHSLKDVPMDLPEGFDLAAILSREDPRDALVSSRYASLQALPADAVVGTSSLRRAAQLRERFPGFRIQPLRGNLDTRLRKLDEGQYDAIVLAAAGLIRLGLAGRIREYLPLDRMMPAPGQGMLGIEIRADRVELRERLAFLNDPAAQLVAEAERAVSRMLGGNCKTPLAAHATLAADGLLQLDALLALDDGYVNRCSLSQVVRDAAQARAVGERAATALRAH
ncbi:MAG: hydroxymethylbilane synthase [Lautropia sp.]|nr:hydroxymethylbilane synthase [Lautropia sp.]